MGPKDRPQPLPTPDSSDRVPTVGRPQLQPRDMSPTPHRSSTRRVKPGDAGLTATILELLRSANVKLSASTEVNLRRTINQEVGIFETKLENLEDSVSELCSKVDELEIAHS
jgi:hypothetical protein